MSIRDDNMQIAVRIAQMLRDVSSSPEGEMSLANGFRARWDALTLVIDQPEADRVFVCAPIGELAALSTERWG